MGRNPLFAFEKMVRKGSPSYLLRDGRNVIWTNMRFIVENDPILMEYFGQFVLEKVLEEGKAHSLNINRGRVQIDSPRLGFDINNVRRILSIDFEHCVELKFPRDPIYIRESDIDCYCLLGEKKPIIINKAYFDYLSNLFQNDFL